MKIWVGITKYLLIFMITMVLAQSAQGGDWTMFMHDLSHSGSADEVVQPPLELLWNYSTIASIESSPVVSKSILYIGDNGGIYAINAATGSLIWNYKTGEVHSVPAVSGDTVYAGSNDYNVYALNVANGALKWKYTTDGGVSSSPAVSDGVIYVGTSYPGKSLYALDAVTGTLKWKYETAESIWSSPAVSDGFVYIGSDDNNIYALDAATGTLKWNYKVKNFFESSPAVSGGVVYVGSGDNNIYALDAATGALKWKYATEKYVHSSPAVSGGVVYVGSDDYSIYALDAVTGALKWSYKTEGMVTSSPAVSNGVVYIGSKDKNLYALDAGKGTLIWKYTAGNSIISSVAVSGGRIYAASTDRIYAFGSESSKRANMKVTMRAPRGMFNGSLINYAIFVNNLGNKSASNVVLENRLPSEVDFISASDNGSYDPETNKVTWNLGSVGSLSGGARMVSVRIRNNIAIGTMIQETSSISTTTPESKYDDNNADVSTIVKKKILPPNLNIQPFDIMLDGKFTVHWDDLVPFEFQACDAATPGNVFVTYHINNNGVIQDIGPRVMQQNTTIPPPGTFWVDLIRFHDFNAHGNLNITFNAPQCTNPITELNDAIYIDPAGYIFDLSTGARIAGATVWLQHPDGNGGWINAPTGQTPPVAQPDVNPLITNSAGQYQWDVLKGIYRVHVEAPGYYPNDSIEVNIPPPVTDLHVGLRQLPLFSISGYKISDTNENRNWDPEEKGLPGWKISLKNATTGVEITNTVTDANGFYIFNKLTNGLYNITEEVQPGYTPTSSTFRIVNVADKDIIDQNFTNKLPAINLLSGMMIIISAFFLIKYRKKGHS